MILLTRRMLRTTYSVAHGQVIELENRYTLDQRPGKIRWMFYWNWANMGNYREALELSRL